MFNQNSRVMYDQKAQVNSSVVTEKPLKFVMDSPTQYKRGMQVPSDGLDTNSNLRPSLSRDHNYDQADTSLFGTAPFKGRGTFEVGDGVRFSDLNQSARSEIAEHQHAISGYAESRAVHIRPELRSRSSRADMKNCHNNPATRAHNQRSHQIKCIP